MKKILPLILFVAFALTSKAQTAVFTLSAAPCHNDGVLTVGFLNPLTPPLTVYWTTQGTNGTTLVHTGVTGLTDALTGYSGGPISVFAVDSNGIVDPTVFYGGSAPFTICPPITLGGICPEKDTVSVSVCSGGTPPFTYQWYNTSTNAVVGTSTTAYVQQGFNYGVTVTDAAGCTYGGMVDPAMSAFAFEFPAFSDTLSATIANCTDGSLSTNIYNGGTPPFSYLWSTGANTPSIGGLVTGLYYVYVTDANGCKVFTSGFVNQAVSLAAGIVATAANCSATDGTVAAFPIGGTAPYTYVWDNGATTQSQSGLDAAVYSVNVTDANGCIGTGSGVVGTSTPMIVTYTTTPSLCIVPTGTATLIVSGGMAPYSFVWHTHPQQTAVTATALIAGTYYYEVTDASGCVANGTVIVPQIDNMIVNTISTPATCGVSNGSITAMPEGGAAPYSYLWSTGTTSASISGKAAGTYQLTVTDHLGCKQKLSPVIPSTSTIGVGFVTTPSSCIFANDGLDSAIVWGGTPPYSYAWSSGGSTRTISGLLTGPFWLTVTDAAGCTSKGNYSYVPYDTLGTSCYCTIMGTVFNDTNNNCLQDPGEPGIPNMQIRINGGTVSAYTYTDASGNYYYKVPSGAYTVSEVLHPLYPLAVCQGNNIPVTSSAGTGCINNVNFANSAVSIHDMHVSTWDYLGSAPVAGMPYSQVMIISNDGTVREDSVLVGYSTDGQLFAPSIVPGEYIDGLPYWYSSPDSFPSVAPQTSQQFLLNYNVPNNMSAGTSIVANDTAAFMKPIANWATDYSPLNNVNSFKTTVATTANANFKEVSPAGSGPAGVISFTDSVLEYMIHFQNTTNEMAENVMIIDTLDNNLDWTTFRPEYTSAPCKISVSQSGTKKIVKFIFSNIDLPNANGDMLRSNGMLTYTIKLMAGLPAGSQVRNRASIYFDYHEPVITNYTTNTVGTANHVSVNNVTTAPGNAFVIYPNPTAKTFNAIINSDVATSADLKISDVTGRLLISKTIALQKGSQTIANDVSQLSPGSYFVTFISGGKTQTQKLVIIK